MKNTVYIGMFLVMLLVFPASGAIVQIDDQSGKTGDEVQVPINISGAPAIGAIDISLIYDASVLSVIDVSKGAITSDALMVTESTIIDNPPLGNYTNDSISPEDNETVWNHGAIAGDTTEGRVNISAISINGFSGDDSIVIVTFRVKGTSDVITQLIMSNVSANETATCDPCNSTTVFDNSSYPGIPIEVVNAEFNVTGGRTSGDVDTHEGLDARDVTYLAKHVAEIAGYETLYGNGDVDTHEGLDARDVTYLAKHVAEIAGYETLYGNGDVDTHEGLDARDVTYLAKHVAEIAGYETLYDR